MGARHLIARGRFAAQLGVSGQVAFHKATEAAGRATSSRVAILARDTAALDGLDRRLDWQRLDWQPLIDDGARAWTDDCAYPLAVLLRH